MPLRLQPAHLDQIGSHGEATYPNECCGILLGHATGGGQRRVSEVVAMRNANTATPHNRFDFDPAEHIAVQRAARERGCDIIGFYHSHPDHPARPSQFDLEHASWPGYSYVIVAIRDGRRADLHSFELAADRSRFNQEAIAVERPEPIEAPGLKESTTSCR